MCVATHDHIRKHTQRNESFNDVITVGKGYHAYFIQDDDIKSETGTKVGKRGTA